MSRFPAIVIAVAAGLGLPVASAYAERTVTLHKAGPDGQGEEVGKVVLSASKYGLVLQPELSGLEPGLHGFHIHENPDCGPAEQDGKTVPAGAAGGHYDPDKTGKHGTPWDDDAHRGDLPPLFVDADGKAVQPVLAPRLKLDDVAGRALMVHAGGDNHSDHPAPLGGGGARTACGVIE